MKIPITKPWFDDEEEKLVAEAIRSGWVSQGRFVEEFEKMFCEFTGSKHAIAVTSCTTALHLSLIALGVGEGDSVIIPSFTFVATANAVEYTGARVIFCDINIRTFNIDTEELKNTLEKEKNVRAIIPVNLFGLCAELPEICKIAKERGIFVIEDSACGFGSRINGKHSGTFGDTGCFSFHPRKVITTGEGGMIITDDDELAEKLRVLRNHGAEVSDLARHKSKMGFLLPEYNMLGYNYRMTDIQGAVGVAQMKKAKKILEERRKIAGKYFEFLSDIDELLPPLVPEGYEHGFQSFVCLFTSGEDIDDVIRGGTKKIEEISRRRDEFMLRLAERGIATRQGTHAVHSLGYYRRKYSLREEDFIKSYAAEKLSVALPLYRMSDDEFNYIAENIKDVLRKI